MEVKPTDLLKVLQRVHEKEPDKAEASAAPAAEGGPVGGAEAAQANPSAAAKS